MIHWLKITDGYPLNIRATHNSRRKVFPDKIEFKPGMNILFGPNGCGKSSIINAIGANGMTVRGWSNMNFSALRLFRDGKADIRGFVKRTLGFGSEMGFDGPVYFHNDYEIRRFAGWSTAGTGIGSGTACAESYLSEHMDNRLRSAGEGEMAIQGATLSNILSGRWAFNRELIEADAEQKLNATTDPETAVCIKGQLDYARESWLKGGAPTLLLDEPELHLDFEIMDGLFTRLLPQFLSQGYQIIMATHYPFAPFLFKDANIIGIDRDVEKFKKYVTELVTGKEK